MKKILLILIATTMLTGVCEARRSRRKQTTTYKYTYSTPVDNTSAQGVADTMASRNCVSHYGGHHNTYEVVVVVGRKIKHIIIVATVIAVCL